MSVLRAKITAWGIPDEVYEDKIRMAQAAGFKLELRKNKEEKWDKWTSDEKIISSDDLIKLSGIEDYIELKPIHTLRFPDNVSKLTPKNLEGVKEIINTTMQVRFEQSWLHKVSQVHHIVDGCTNELDGFLSQGWKILAVCPQHGQRRPDYILGREERKENETL